MHLSYISGSADKFRLLRKMAELKYLHIQHPLKRRSKRKTAKENKKFCLLLKAIQLFKKPVSSCCLGMETQTEPAWL